MSSQTRKTSAGGNKRSLDVRRGVSDAQLPADKLDNSNLSVASSDSEELGKTPSKSVKRSHADGAGVELSTSSRHVDDSIDTERSESHATIDKASARNHIDKADASMAIETRPPIPQAEGVASEAKPIKLSSHKPQGRQSVPNPAQTKLSDDASNQLAASPGSAAAKNSKTSATQAFVSNWPTEWQQEHIHRMQQKTSLQQQRAETQRQAFLHAMPRPVTQSSVLQPQGLSYTGTQVVPNTRINPSFMLQMQAAHDQGFRSTDRAPRIAPNEAPRSFSDGVLGRPSVSMPPTAQSYQPQITNIQAKQSAPAYDNSSDPRVPRKQSQNYLRNQQPAMPALSNIDSGELPEPIPHRTAIGRRAYSQNGLSPGHIRVGNVVLEPIQAVEYLLDENHRLVDVNSIYIGRSGEVNCLSGIITDLNYKLADLNFKLAEHSKLIEERSSLRQSIIRRDAIIAQLSANLQRSQQELLIQRYTPLSGQPRHWDTIGIQNQAASGQQGGQSSSQTRASTAAAHGSDSQRQWPDANGFRSDGLPRDDEQAESVERENVQNQAKEGGPSVAK